MSISQKFIILFLSLCLVNISAGPLKNIPQKLKQPDGSILNCYASGDEFYNWIHDKDGYTIVKNKITNYWVYAKSEGSNITYSNYIPGTIDPKNVGLEPKLLPPKERIIESVTSKRTILQESIQSINSINNLLKKTSQNFEERTKGVINNLVIFIRFSDEPEFSIPFINYNEKFNGISDSSKSLRKFFKKSSYSQLDVVSTFPQSTNGSNIISYKDSHTRNYYRTTAFSPDSGSSNPFSRGSVLFENALKSVSTKISPNLNLDHDNNGLVDNVIFIISGSPDGWAEFLWPHMGIVNSNTLLNGKKVGAYNLQMNNILDVYTLCHEFFHTLGSPDLYHYVSQPESPTGGWDLMDGGTEISSYMRFKYGKWIKEIPLISQKGTYSINALIQSDSSNVSYMLKSPYSKSQFFVFEYRDEENDKGLLIYRINSSVIGNAYGPPDEVYAFRKENSNNHRDFLFSPQFGRTALNDFSSPACILADGRVGGIRISGIQTLSESRKAIFIVEDILPIPTIETEWKSITDYRNIKCVTEDINKNRWFGSAGQGLIKFDGVNYSNFTTANSPLPDNNINSIQCDLNGVLWIGTNNGLVKYNGTSWVVFDKFNSPLTFSTINKIVLDKYGSVWVSAGSDNYNCGSLHKFDGSGWFNYTVSSRFYTFNVDSFGNVWFADWNQLSKFNGVFTIKYKSNINQKDISLFPTDISFDKNNNVWITSNSGWIEYTPGVRTIVDGGLYKFDGSNWSAFTKSNCNLPDGNIQSLNIDKNGSFWLGSLDGYLIKFDLVTFSFYKNPDYAYNSINSSRFFDDKVWCATKGGIDIFNPQISLNNSPSFLNVIGDLTLKVGSTFSVQLKAADPNNSLLRYSKLTAPIDLELNSETGDVKWNLSKKSYLGKHQVSFLVTNVLGMKDTLSFVISLEPKIDYANWYNFTQFNSQLPSNNIGSIAADSRGPIWFGTDQGLVKFDGKLWSLYNTNNSLMKTTWLQDLKLDLENKIWIASYGIYSFDNVKWTSYNSNPIIADKNIFAITVDKTNIKWFGTNKGLLKFDGTTWSLLTVSDINSMSNYIVNIISDGFNNKWLCTMSGLVKYDNVKFTNIVKPFLNTISTIDTDKNNSVWVASYGIVAKYDGTNWSIFNNTNSIIPNDELKSLKIDLTGNVWIGSENSGVYKYDGNSWTNFNENNSGLLSNTIRSIAVDNNNSKWFGGYNFNPGAVGSGLSLLGSIPVSVIPDSILPDNFELSQNYPNPFNPSTTIKYSLKTDAKVYLAIYNVLGQKVEELINNINSAGYHQVVWNNPKNLSSGIYFYSLQVNPLNGKNSIIFSKKMILLK